MKHARKLAGILLAMVMALALALPAFAATVTVTDDKGILKDHAFTAYQIFNGNFEGGVLTNVDWGSGINSTEFLKALKNDTTIGENFTDYSTAADVAEVLADFGNDSDVAKKVAELAYANKTATGTALTVGTTALADGYYLVVDTTTDVGEGGAYNKALLQVVGDIKITVKTDAPSVEKKVQENKKDLTASENNVYGNKYNDVADYNMGDAVPFKLIGTVPDMSKYDTYKYIFHDTMSNGLTLNADSIKVYVASDKEGTNKEEITEGWNKETSGQTFTVSFANLKTVANVTTGKYIIVEYTATLNQGAVVGLDGNPNEVYLEYSNKPDQSGEGDTNNTGRTPEDKVIVFTYELDVTKVDGDKTSTALKDAEFKLKNSEGKWAIVGTDGKITGWADAEENGSTLKSGEDGKFSVIGLDDGTYYLKETKAPTGYNLLKNPVEVKITATTVNNQAWGGTASDALTTLAVTADGKSGTASADTGKAGITIANNKGSTLPSTGGIGTTIFYVVGSILVLAAVVLLITKKRMSEDK